MKHVFPTPRSLGALVCLTLLSWPALAQGVYRHVGPDGRVTFSDQPPVETPARSARNTVAATPSDSGGTLPYELRQVASRFPVTLFTSKDCAPCNSGRNLLNARGVPFTEKTVNSAEDIAALRRLNGDGSLPLMTVGAQQIKGYSDTQWTQYLDAAGYPKQSKLPMSYSRPAPAPLVATTVTASTPTSRTTETAASAPPVVPVAPPVSNPAGIRF